MEYMFEDGFDHRVLANSHRDSSSENKGLLDGMVLDYLHLPRFPSQDPERIQDEGQMTLESCEGDLSCLGNLTHIVDCLDDLSGVQPINWNLSVADFKDLLADSMDCEEQDFVYTSSPYPSSVSSQELCSLTFPSETTDSSNNNSSSSSQQHSLENDSGYVSRTPICNFLEEFGKSLKDELTVPSPIQPADRSMSGATASCPVTSELMSSWCQEQQQQQQQQQQFQQPQTLLTSFNHQLSVDRSSLCTKNSGDEKPHESYVALVAKAIMSVPDHRMLFNDIYKHILDSYPYFNTAKCAWRSSVRHALSTNECFIKSGRAPNGRGSYWAIHPVSKQDFNNGDFNKRRARHRVQKLTRQTDALVNNNMTNQTPTNHHQTVAPSGDSYMPMTSTPVRTMDFSSSSSSNMSHQYNRQNKSQCPGFDVHSLPRYSTVYRFQQISDFAGCFLNSFDH